MIVHISLLRTYFLQVLAPSVEWQAGRVEEQECGGNVPEDCCQLPQQGDGHPLHRGGRGEDHLQGGGGVFLQAGKLFP